MPEEYIQRMKEEHAQLEDRIKKLEAFIYDERGHYGKIDRQNQVLLCQQLAYMKSYLSVLDQRLWIAHN